MLFGAAALALAAMLVGSSLDTMFSSVIPTVQAQDHGADGGQASGGESGGHSSGGGSDGGAGHSGGAGSGGGGHDGGAGAGHSGGGHEGGGSGAGHSGGGHEGGGSGGGHAGGEGGPQYRGGEHPAHGTRAEHEGHASGVHGQSHGGTAHGTGADRRFGGGSGLAGLEQVPEGPARMRYTYEYGNQYSLGTGPGDRFRYWGGWVIPGDEDTGDEPTSVAETPLSTGGGGPSAAAGLQALARCDDVSGTMSSAASFSGRNVQRATAARAILAPATVSDDAVPSPYLLVSFQEEVQKPNPDLLVAGTYLGLEAKVPVTEEIVKQVAWRMCVTLDDASAGSIAAAAEVQRLADLRRAGVAKAGGAEH